MLRPRVAQEADIRTLFFLAVLAVVWLLWSGLTVQIHWHDGVPALEVEGLLLAFAAGSIALIAAVGHRMDTVDRDRHPMILTWRPLAYCVWMLKEIALSGLHVSRVILDRELHIQPQLVRVQTSQASDLGHVIHANSITLTPGTVSLDVREGTILVHALTDHTAEGVMSGDMDRRVTWVEGSG